MLKRIFRISSILQGTEGGRTAVGANFEQVGGDDRLSVKIYEDPQVKAMLDNTEMVIVAIKPYKPSLISRVVNALSGAEIRD